MVKILVVDDEYEKARDLQECLSSEHLEVDVEHVSTANAARQRMSSASYDLLILDLNLPDAVGASPSSDGGLRLFDMLKLDFRVQLPTDVFFITGKEELLQSSVDVERRGATLYGYDVGEVKWRTALIGRVAYISARKERAAKQIDIAIVTALRSPELNAVLDLDYSWSSRQFIGDPTVYHLGNIVRKDATLTVVAATAQRKGMASSAALASRMAALFSPKLIVMLGICAGKSKKANIGDIIVADPAWDWGSGKHAIDHSGSPVFQMSPHQTPLDARIAQVVTELENDSVTAHSIRGLWAGDLPKENITIRKGPMASGASVLADGNTLQVIADQQNRDLLAVDMEAYAVMAAAEYFAGSRIEAIAIKSVCDFGDAEKSNDWQSFAAFTAARFFDALIKSERFPAL